MTQLVEYRDRVRQRLRRDAPDAAKPGAPPRKGPDRSVAIELPLAPERDNLPAARQILRDAPSRLAEVEVDALADAAERIETAYRLFPELELEFPRRKLVENLRVHIERTDDHRAIPLRIVGTALDSSGSSDFTADLLTGLAGGARPDLAVEFARLVRQRRALSLDDVAPAIRQLGANGDQALALSLLAEVLGSESPDWVAAQLAAALEGAEPNSDLIRCSRKLQAARDRVRDLAGPHLKTTPNARLLETAERLALKLPRTEGAAVANHGGRRLPSGRIGFAQFALQWPQICGVELEWLPAMQIGRAGERRDGFVCAKAGQTGHLVFGPYVRLLPGEYRARIRWSAGRPSRSPTRGQRLAAIEAVSECGNSYLAQHEMCAEDCARAEHVLSFRIPRGRPPEPIEIRIWTAGVLALTLSSVAVERLGP